MHIIIILEIIPTSKALITKNLCKLANKPYIVTSTTNINTFIKWDKLLTAKKFHSCSHGYENHLIVGFSLYKC